MTSLDLRNIASAGGNLVINADKFTALDLKNIASSGVGTKCKLTIKKAGKLTGLFYKEHKPNKILNRLSVGYYNKGYKTYRLCMNITPILYVGLLLLQAAL